MLIILSIFGLVTQPPARVTSFLPLGNLYLEMPMIFISLPLASTLGAIVGGYLLTPIYLWLHQMLFRENVYSIQKVQRPEIFQGMFQGFYPALLAFNLNSMIVEIWPGLLDFLLSPELLEAPFMYQYSFVIVLLSVFTIAVSMAVFSPAYFLLDGGVLYSTDMRAKRSGRPKEIRTVGGWFNDYLKGYAGLSVAFSYLIFVYRYISAFEMELIYVLFWVGLPFFVMVNTIPTYIYLDKISLKIDTYVLNFSNKMIRAHSHNNYYQV